MWAAFYPDGSGTTRLTGSSGMYGTGIFDINWAGDVKIRAGPSNGCTRRDEIHLL